jgi:polysaccharide export outer membrane protein
MAQRALGNRTLYAQALAYLAEHRQSARQPLLATGMGGLKMVLLERIRNVLGLGSVQHGRWYGPSCALIGAVIASVMWVVTLGFGPRHDESTAEPPYEIGFQASSDEPRDAATGLGAPTEMTKMTLPSYHIAPPDVLFIEAIRIIPKSPYHIQTGDELSVVFDLDEATLKSGRGFFVDPDGRISLGPLYGKVHVGGLTIDEATDVVLKRLRDVFKDPQVALSVVQTTGFQPITGEHLVSPDGMVSLGMYGQVRVAGMTLDEARAAVEQKLSFVLDHPQVSLSVFAYNSHVYYVISEGPSGGDFVTRLPSTGSETVLDAIAQVPGLTDLSRKRIWIARPSPGGKDTILKVNWIEITKGAATNKNFQVLPGDRIFVTERSMTRRSASVDRPTATSPPTTQAVRKFRLFDTLDRISMAD